MEKQIIELALEALQARKIAVEAQIAQLTRELKGGTRALTTKELGNISIPAVRRKRTAAERRKQSLKMKAYWAARKKQPGNKKAAAKAVQQKVKRGPQSATARKQASERMKQYWKNRRAAAQKKAE